MNFVRIKNTDADIFKQAMYLYANSFPPYEQRKLKEQLEVMIEPDYHFNLLYTENTFIGLVLYWEQEHFIYVEHFCTVPEVRNKGYGMKILDMLAALGKTIILEIDPPKDEVSIRRQKFYERAGYISNQFAHIHLPYQTEYQGHRLVVLSRPLPLTGEHYLQFNEYLQNKVMFYAEKRAEK